MKAKLAQVRKVSLVLGTLSLVATLLAGCDDGGGEFGNCYFISDETSSISAPQTAVVFAPTSNFVDFSSIIGRAATPVKELSLIHI